MNKLTFTVARIYRLPDAGDLKAFVDVRINDLIEVRGTRIIEGKHGLIVVMPREQGKDGKYYSNVVCLDEATTMEFERVVLEHYNTK